MAYNRWHSSSGFNEPITYVGGHPVDLTTLITALHVVTTLICAVALAVSSTSVWVDSILFSTNTFWQGKVWNVFADPFYHDISREHVWLVVGLFFFYRFGTEIERLIGRSNFGLLYLALIVIPAMVCLAAAPLLGFPLGVRVLYIGSLVHFSIFIGFTYIYPDALFFGMITARLTAFIFITVTTLAILVLKAWPMLIPFGASLATVYFFLSFVGAGRDLSILEVWQSWREQKQDQKIQKRKARIQSVKRKQEASVDAILDKISEHGIHTLTRDERAFLEKKGTQLRAGERGRD